MNRLNMWACPARLPAQPARIGRTRHSRARALRALVRRLEADSLRTSGENTTGGVNEIRHNKDMIRCYVCSRVSGLLRQCAWLDGLLRRKTVQ